MQYEIQQYQPGGARLARDVRHVARSVSRYRADSQITVCGIDSVTDTTLAKIDSATVVTGQAMGAVLRVAQAQKQAELANPDAAGRLALLADDHTLAMVDISVGHRRIIRRF